MSFLDLLALNPPLNLYPGAVPSTPKFPYVLVNSSVPGVTERSAVRSPQARIARHRVTVVGMSAESVRIIATRVNSALEHKVVQEPGFNPARVESEPNEQPILQDLDVALAGGLYPSYLVLDFKYTLSPA